MHRHLFLLFHNEASGWRRYVGCCFLAWLFFDLCVVHMVRPQYAAAELFGVAVPAVVVAPLIEGEEVLTVVTAPVVPQTAGRSLPAHTCFWNTQWLLAVPAVPLPVRGVLASGRPHAARGTIQYAHFSPSDIFHPPRLT